MPNTILPPLARAVLPAVMSANDPRLAQLQAISGEPSPGPTNAVTDATGNYLTDANGNYLIWSE